jgi:site-specific DNA-methyltransferase (adenine-specific)
VQNAPVGTFERGWSGDSGSAARFFYTAKADKEDRAGSKHPTVKPVDLMCWLVRLVTPKGGTVLDPFAGTGTTGQAALMEGMKAILIEQQPDYFADIQRRMAQPIQLGGLV